MTRHYVSQGRARGRSAKPAVPTMELERAKADEPEMVRRAKEKARITLRSFTWEQNNEP